MSISRCYYFGRTLEIIETFSIGSVALEYILTTLFCLPILPDELNDTLISAVLPGAIGSFGHLGTVQPDVAATLEIIKGAFPVFSRLKVCSTLSPCLMSPKSLEDSLNLITGPSFSVFSFAS